jgi:hypothetical protein
MGRIAVGASTAIAHTFYPAGSSSARCLAPCLQIISASAVVSGVKHWRKESKMNSPNNLLFDWEIASSRVRKAFEPAPESDLDDRS